MDYDRNDALLHWIFRQTQGDAWFRPDEHDISSGVALRVSDANDQPEFRVFPYENETLEPFETAVCALNPFVAVKVRSATVHAALAELDPDAKSVYLDANTRIQIIDTILLLPQADREQSAAFIRDERTLVIWSESLDTIIPTCHDFEERLIKLLWRSKPSALASHLNGSSTPASASSIAPSLDGHGDFSRGTLGSPRSPTPIGLGKVYGMSIDDPEFRAALNEKGKDKEEPAFEDVVLEEKRTWYGKKYQVQVDLENQRRKRPTKLYAPLYNGLAAALSLVFIGNGIRTLLREYTLDGDFVRFALVALAPLLFCVSLFFSSQLIQNLTNAVGPIAHYHTNSTYYSAKPPLPNLSVDNNLPHVTIQMPVYKESLEKVLMPSIESLKKAMRTYARQGGTCTLLVCDDGLRLLDQKSRDERISYYANHNIGWVARPRHDGRAGGYKRMGRFKKASNMNYGLALSLKVEKHLEKLLAEAAQKRISSESQSQSPSLNLNHFGNGGRFGSRTMNGSGRSGNGQRFGWFGSESVSDHGHWNTTPGASPTPPTTWKFQNGWNGMGASSSNASMTAGSPQIYIDSEDLEEKALALAIEETFLESQPAGSSSFSQDEQNSSDSTSDHPQIPRPWAANSRALRIGTYILLVDSDTIVPEDCIRDAVREFTDDEKVGIIQHESDVMQVVGHWFENGVAYFTRRVNRCISIACANGEVAPFVGHNAFLRWKAMQDSAFVDPADGKEKIWSESNVSEDFDMALRMLQRGYIIRWATYSKGGFKEGVSLSVDDELNRWQKYAYGCNELLFNPLVQWWRRGPIAPQIHKFIWSNAPLHYKISMLSYMFSYYGLAASTTISLVNYVLLGFQFPVDGWFMHSFEILLATVVVFWGTGTAGYTLLEYRLGEKKLIPAFIENLIWIPFFFFFFGGLSIPLTQAILAHLFSYDIQWTATVKEVERSNFFKEIPKIWKRFWFSIVVSWTVIVGIVLCAINMDGWFVPYEWRIDEEGWAVILPLAMSAACHILFPIVLNPWLMVFSY